MTYRERRERRAERLREWAEKRESGAAAVFKQGEPYRGDHAFNTQPGHIPERARLIAREDRAYDSTKKAREMRGRAAEIDRQIDNAIYDDDPDAIKRLEAKVAGLETQRERIKSVNKAVRAGKLDEVPDRDRKLLDNIATHQPFHKPYERGYPSYALTNLSGNIRRLRLRLEGLRNPAPVRPRVLTLRYGGNCEDCGRKLERDDIATYNREDKTIRCYSECEEVTA